MGWVDRWADRGSGSPGPGRSSLPAKRDASGPPGYVWHCHFAPWSGPIQKEPEQIHESLRALRHLVAGPGLPRLKGLVEPSPAAPGTPTHPPAVATLHGTPWRGDKKRWSTGSRHAISRPTVLPLRDGFELRPTDGERIGQQSMWLRRCGSFVSIELVGVVSLVSASHRANPSPPERHCTLVDSCAGHRIRRRRRDYVHGNQWS